MCRLSILSEPRAPRKYHLQLYLLFHLGGCLGSDLSFYIVGHEHLLQDTDFCELGFYHIFCRHFWLNCFDIPMACRFSLEDSVMSLETSLGLDSVHFCCLTASSCPLTIACWLLTDLFCCTL